MPNDAYEAWWAYFIEHAQRSELAKAQAEHDRDMDHVRKALTH